ncbi:MAG: hypothetical protein MN733_36035 [Nitrososphaera sp.]|nr:hypothetical protein [Nitrososphaera sp.]
MNLEYEIWLLQNDGSFDQHEVSFSMLDEAISKAQRIAKTTAVDHVLIYKRLGARETRLEWSSKLGMRPAS